MKIERPPKPSVSPLTMLNQLNRRLFKYFVDLQQELGDLVYLPIPFNPMYLVCNLEDIHHVLVENHDNYGKDRSFRQLQPLLGNGLLISHGSFWKKQRKLVQPAFRQKNLVRYFEAIDSCIDELLEEWNFFAVNGAEFDICSAMRTLTLQIIGKALFSCDLKSKAPQIETALTIILTEASKRMEELFNLRQYLPIRANFQFRKSLKYIDDLVYEIIRDHRANLDRYNDILTVLMNIEDADTGEKMSDEQLRDEILNLIVAGHETTANALAWAWYLLSTHPTVNRKMRQEITDNLGDQPLTYQDLEKLTYLKMVVDEVLRLYPSVPIIPKENIEVDYLSGYKISKKSAIYISPYVMHRHSKYWHNPEGFDPERFLNLDRKKLKYIYLPFAEGPHTCIGKFLALIEIQTTLIKISQKYWIDVKPGHPIDEDIIGTLRPKYGLKVKLRNI